MFRYNFRHQKRHLMRCIKFSRLLSCIFCKVGNQVFIDKSQNIIVLFSIHRNFIYKLNQIAYCLCLWLCICTKLWKSCFKSCKYSLKQFFMWRWYVSAKWWQSGSNIVNREIRSHIYPSWKQVLICYKVSQILLQTWHTWVTVIRLFINIFLDIIRIISSIIQILLFFVWKILIKDKAQYIILIFIGFNLWPHLICRLPNLCRKLLFIHFTSPLSLHMHYNFN